MNQGQINDGLSIQTRSCYLRKGQSLKSPTWRKGLDLEIEASQSTNLPNQKASGGWEIIKHSSMEAE